MYADRIEKYKLLEESFNGKILSYITGDRVGFETQIEQDAIDLIIDHLDKIGVVERLLLYLYTRGGNTAVAWNIVNLLRMYCDELYIIVPHKAHSAGTLISLGAEKIIMTKQATLSPIDPSIVTSLNPMIQNGPVAQPFPVSVEAIQGFIELAHEEFSVKENEEAVSKLADYVHPIVLGEAYRSRGQIKRLARELLAYQSLDEKKVDALVDFLCSDSGSHDYTINRREAKDKWSLNAAKPTDEQYIIIKEVYEDFSQELGLRQALDPRRNPGAYAVRRGFIESIYRGSDYFITEGTIEAAVLPDGQEAVKSTIAYEGWRHDNEIAEIQEAILTTERGEVQYEQDGDFKL